MQSKIKILKINEVRSGVKNGKEWSMQDAECILMNDDGSIGNVGVLQLPKSLMGDKLPKHGDYTASFALHAGFDRKINAVLTALTPLGAPAAAASK